MLCTVNCNLKTEKNHRFNNTVRKNRPQLSKRERTARTPELFKNKLTEQHELTGPKYLKNKF